MKSLGGRRRGAVLIGRSTGYLFGSPAGVLLRSVQIDITYADKASRQTPSLVAWRDQDAAIFNGSWIETGVLLRRLQRGELISLPHSRPMPSIGNRCYELRVLDRDEAWRVVYRIDSDAILSLTYSARRPGRHHIKSSSGARRDYVEYNNIAG